MKAVYLRGVTSGVRVMGAFINAISHRLSVRVSESHDDLRYVRTVRNGAETISFCTRSWKTLVATLPRKINAGEVVFSAPLIFLSPFISFNSGRPDFSPRMTNRISAIEIIPHSPPHSRNMSSTRARHRISNIVARVHVRKRKDDVGYIFLILVAARARNNL